MKSKYKFFTSIAVLLLLPFMISACTSSEIGDNDLTNTYNLTLNVVGDGGILVDSINSDESKYIQSSETLQLSRYSNINLLAIDYPDDFLLWTGDYNELEQKQEQNIYMSTNKEITAVFGDPSTYYMYGNIEEAWGHNNVTGYWRVIINNEDLNDQFNKGTIDLSARETIGAERKYIKVFEDEVNQGDYSLGEIAYVRPQQVTTSDLADYEYIAAILRVEEVNDQELFLFVYSDYQNVEILIWEETLTSIETYNNTLAEYNENDDLNTDFKNKVIEVINNNKNNEYSNYLSGNTLKVNDPFEAQ
ncbi:MAG: hypothetical protein ACOCZY_02280 [Bacillota bacterium]